MNQNLLILVHPGSLCGSANYNLGRAEARSIREQTIFELNNWNGDILVLDGELSDEIPEYPQLDQAIQSAIEKAKKNGFGKRLEADDPEHPFIALKEMTKQGYVKNTNISLAGAWYDPKGPYGCINATLDELKRNQFEKVKILNCSARTDFDYEEELQDFQNPSPSP